MFVSMIDQFCLFQPCSIWFRYGTFLCLDHYLFVICHHSSSWVVASYFAMVDG